MTPTAAAMGYLGLDELGEQPHVMVDGAPRPGTVLTLSHWPVSPTPERLWRDLSTEIVLAYLLEVGAGEPVATIATCDHLDVDGLAGLFLLNHPEVALEHQELVVEIARVGDFGVVRSIEAAEIAWALEALMEDPDLALVEFRDAEVTREGARTLSYRALLHVLGRMIGDRTTYEALYRAPRERFDATNRRIEEGEIALVEYAAAELCVVHVDPDIDSAGAAGDRDGDVLGVDPYAIQSATDSPRVLVAHGGHYRYYDRYETWLRYVSRRLPLRRDLAGLARELTARDRVAWSADAASSITPVLRHGEGPSRIGETELVERLVDYLETEPAAWDPFRSGGPLRP